MTKNDVDTVYCPLYGANIDEMICFDITIASEGMSPERFVEKKIRKIKNYKEICLACKNHRD